MVASRPQASDSLRSAHGRKDTLSKNTRRSVFILRIFSQFVISSGFHFSMIAQFKVKCGSNPFALCAIATILLARSRGCHSGLAGPLLGLHKTSAASYCIARSLYHHPPLTRRTKLLDTDQFRHMSFRCVGILLILGVLKIVIYVQYLVCIIR